MAIRSIIFPILREVLPLSGKTDLLMYGVQDVRFDAESVRNNFSVSEFKHNNSSLDPYDFFKMLGFSNVYSLDINPEDNPSYLANLNEAVPGDLHDRFDFIYDGGTLEHIFNVEKSFENGVNMLRQGGMIFHFLPMNNRANHGFYQFSPGLFFDYYYFTNNFTDCNVFFVDKNRAQRFGPRDIIPKSILKSQSMLAFVAKKTPHSSSKHPLQYMYSQNTKGLYEEVGENFFYIWGTSRGFKNVYQKWLDEHHDKINFLGFIDSDKRKHGQTLNGFNIYPPSALKHDKKATIVIIASTFIGDIESTLLEMGVNLRLLR